MPKLDGVSATSIIRQFDHTTPIISMTSNSKPTEIMSYYSSGMNDILPKPFNKQGLLTMLEKHLSGLREMGKAVTSIPRLPGEGDDETEDDALKSQVVEVGSTDEEYNKMFQDLVSNDAARDKRSLEEDESGPRLEKKARLEL